MRNINTNYYYYYLIYLNIMMKIINNYNFYVFTFSLKLLRLTKRFSQIYQKI